MHNDNKEVLQILTFLFRNCIQANGKIPEDKKSMKNLLSRFGFKKNDIYKALDWLSGITQNQIFLQEPKKSSLRLLTSEENMRLNLECRRFLVLLEQNEILKPKTREIVISQLLRLNQRDIDISDIKLVTLMVLFSQPEEKAALLRFEQLILD